MSLEFLFAKTVRFSTVAAIRALLAFLLFYESSAQVITPGAFPATVDDQTGYFLHTVTVANNTGADFAGIRLTVHNLPADTETNAVRVANAHGLTNNIPFFDFGRIAAGAAPVEFTIAYYVRNRRTLPSPTYQVTVHGGIPLLPLPTTIVVTNNATRFADGKFFAEFKTDEGRAYFVQYNSSITNTNGWRTALPAIRGTGKNVQWQDFGPPATESKPLTEGSRFYRVLVLPQ